MALRKSIERQYKPFMQAAAAATEAMNAEQNRLFSAGVANQPATGTVGKPTVDDALRTARAVSRSRLKSTFRFLEECGQPVDEVKRKPAMRAAKKIRGGAAKKGGKQRKV